MNRILSETTTMGGGCLCHSNIQMHSKLIVINRNCLYVVLRACCYFNISTTINEVHDRVQVTITEKLDCSNASNILFAYKIIFVILYILKSIFIVIAYLICHDLQQVLYFACMSLFYKNKRDNTHRRRSCSE